jgi:hypothetical protein
MHRHGINVAIRIALRFSSSALRIGPVALPSDREFVACKEMPAVSKN